MAHGCEGYVYDVNETKVALKEIKDCIKSAGIPSEIPKLLIVQACRTDEAPRSEASTGLDSPIKKAVEIGKELLQNLGVPIPVNSKPENLKLENFKIENPKCEVAESAEYPNFITIMACSKGQKALRNVFMPLLLEELGKGNEINDAVRKVKQRMKRKSGETSTPEICNDCDSLIYLSKEKGHQ
ncbi:uncharacterized protein [Watersipora subatra]|uniref:uncharacterized protein n=1 Tax=Watersipora subatra TaxID=2589382 RepID=UPI00355B5392